MSHFDTIIVGGGAAGLMCAIVSSENGKNVLLIEHNKDLGKKILVSGGGRCNFTNINTTHEDFLSENMHFHKSALSRYDAYDFIDLITKHKVTYNEKKMGQLFCDQKAPAILKVLVQECLKNRVSISTSTTVTSLQKIDTRFKLQTNKGELSCDNLVIATGGLSFSALGASDFGYKVATQFGLKVIPTSPALVPLVQDGFKELAGVALNVSLTLGKRIIKDDLLFTHKGFSGPAILKISLWWKSNEKILMDMLPGQSIEQLIDQRKKHPDKKKRNLGNLLASHLPESLVKKWLRDYLPGDNNDINSLSKKDIVLVTKMIHQFELNPTSTEGYRKAEVTRGGVDTAELSSKTMETKKIDGLYFIGEVVDTTGLLGGYNFQWCWACAHAAGIALQ